MNDASSSPRSPSTRPSVASALASRMSSVWVRAMAAFTLLITATGCSGGNFFDLIQRPRWGCTGTVIIILDVIALVDVIGDRSRDTANRVLWSLAIIFMPLLGVILYFLFGKK